MNTRQRKALETKDKIYNSALHLIKEKGYENVLIEDITNHAGIAKGSFYNHFSSKENLLYYTYIKTNKIYAQAYKKIEDEKDLFSMMNSFIKFSYLEIEKLGNEIIRAMCVNLLSKESKDIFFNKKRGLYKSLTNIINKSKDSGYLDNDRPTEFYVNKIITYMIGIENYWCLLDRDSGLPEFAKENIKTLLVGLANL